MTYYLRYSGHSMCIFEQFEQIPLDTIQTFEKSFCDF